MAHKSFKQQTAHCLFLFTIRFSNENLSKYFGFVFQLKKIVPRGREMLTNISTKQQIRVIKVANKNN
jgi:hypothetical protein